MYQLAQSNLWKGRLDSETDSRQFRHFQTVKYGDLTKVEKTNNP
ncbi:formimidoylglutamase, partial [Staphylococcus caprae]